jgi:hypothetical protein
MQETAIQRAPVFPVSLHDMARHHFQRMAGRTLQEMFQDSSFAVIADFTGVFGVADFGAVQVTGGARWDQLFPPKKGAKR